MLLFFRYLALRYKFAESFNRYVRTKNKGRKIIGDHVSQTNYKPRDYSPRINVTYATLLQSRKTFVTVIIIRATEYAILCRVKK